MRTHHFRSEVIYLARNFKVRSCSLYLSTCPYCCPFSVMKSHSKAFHFAREPRCPVFVFYFLFVCIVLKTTRSTQSRSSAPPVRCQCYSAIPFQRSRLCTSRAAPSAGGPSPALPAPLRLRCRAPVLPPALAHLLRAEKCCLAPTLLSGARTRADGKCQRQRFLSAPEAGADLLGEYGE